LRRHVFPVPLRTLKNLLLTPSGDVPTCARKRSPKNGRVGLASLLFRKCRGNSSSPLDSSLYFHSIGVLNAPHRRDLFREHSNSCSEPRPFRKDLWSALRSPLSLRNLLLCLLQSEWYGEELLLFSQETGASAPRPGPKSN